MPGSDVLFQVVERPGQFDGVDQLGDCPLRRQGAGGEEGKIDDLPRDDILGERVVDLVVVPRAVIDAPAPVRPGKKEGAGGK